MSYAGVTAFTRATGVRPKLAVYYSGWLEPFRTSFATAAAEHGALPLVQIDPTDISLAAIASGRYDAYLTSYARAVRAYRKPVILSFGHEMNGTWFSWGWRYTSPTVFVAAWRHIVTLFRTQETRSVTWLWTVNIIKTKNGQISSPAPWWPGSSYVTWVGVDGYYLKPSWQFVPIFGPTIAALRELTGDPILIAETSATPAASQPRSLTCSLASTRTGCWDSYGSTTSRRMTTASTVPRLLPRSGKVPRHTAVLNRERGLRLIVLGLVGRMCPALAGGRAA